MFDGLLSCSIGFWLVVDILGIVEGIEDDGDGDDGDDDGDDDDDDDVCGIVNGVDVFGTD